MKPLETQTHQLAANTPPVGSNPPLELFDWQAQETLPDAKEPAQVVDALPASEILTSDIMAVLPVGNNDEEKNTQTDFRPPENTYSQRPNQWRLTKRKSTVIAAATGIGLLVSATFWPHSLHKGNEPRIFAPPAATAPAPTYDTVSPTTEATIAQTIPSTTIAKASLAPATTSLITKPPATAETTVLQAPLLSAEKKQALIDATGFEGLKNHNLDIASEYDTAAAHIVIIQLDGAPLVVPVAEIKADIAAAEAEAASLPSFTANIQLGPGVAQDITFDVKPSKLDDNGQDTHYFISAGPNQDLAALAQPMTVYASKDMKSSFVAFTKSSPYQHENVSILQNQLDKQEDTLNANSFAAAVETLQSSASFSLSLASAQQLHNEKLDMSYLTNPNAPGANYQDVLDDVGRELWTNSMAYAHVAARIGMTYEHYKLLAPTIPLRAYPSLNVYYFTVDAATYAAMQTN